MHKFYFYPFYSLNYGVLHEAGQPSGSSLVTKPAGDPPVPRVADPAPGFSKIFPSTREFLAFTRAEIEWPALSCPLRGEELHAREVREAADEEMLDARELRVSRLEEELQQRLSGLEDQVKAHLEMVEQFHIRAAQDEDRQE